MPADQPLIAIIDGNESFRAELRRLLQAAGLTIELFSSAEDFLRRREARSPHCVVLDVRLPGMSGLDLQSRQARTGRRTPLLFLTAQNEARACVQAMKAGAIDCLIRPFGNEQLLDAVQRAVACDQVRRLQDQRLDKLRARLASLSPRERQAMLLLSAGQGPKQIAGQLGVCTHTARVHAGRIMSKMGAQSIAELVRMADTLGHESIERARVSGSSGRTGQGQDSAEPNPPFPRMKPAISTTPCPLFRLEKTKGRAPLMRRASDSMT
ncbi:response regulator transcription factor [Bradyrhizobium liaoningense]|nr:response regulator transcription factor [Bradyrhizobium liaoningense]